MLSLQIPRKYHKILKYTAILIFLLMIAELSLPPKSVSAEAQRTVYYGDEGANSVIQYLSFSDVGADNWAAEAIYETSALGFLAGFKDTSGRFGRTVPLTKAEALAVVYRAGMNRSTGVVCLFCRNMTIAIPTCPRAVKVWCI